jgi:RNA polymerase sigma-70 factor, ECF subfamily
MASGTHATLLERLRDAADPLAWDEFFLRYWRLIFSFARRRGCSDHTAEEIVQEVLLAVFQQRAVFQYDRSQGRFRDWLATVVRNLVAAQRRKPSNRVRAVGGESADAETEAQQAAPDAAWEAAFEASLLATLLDVVRREVNPATFQAFEMSVLGELPGSRIAAMTGLSRNAVYLARKRVVRRLQELGAGYADDGRLHQAVRDALRWLPGPLQERAVTKHVRRTMNSARESSG